MKKETFTTVSGQTYSIDMDKVQLANIPIGNNGTIIIKVKTLTLKGVVSKNKKFIQSYIDNN